MIKNTKKHSNVISFFKNVAFAKAKKLAAKWLMGFGARSVSFAVWPLLSLSALYGGAHAQGGLQIEALGQSYTVAQPVASGLTRLTFFRPVNDSGAKAVSVYINQAYYTSLTKGGFAQACIKSAPVDIGLRRVEDASIARNPIYLEEIRLQSGSQMFLRVSDQPGVSMPLQAVTASQAESELAQTRLQVHTVSRATSVVPCVDAPVLASALVQVAPAATPLPVVVAPLPALEPTPLITAPAVKPAFAQPELISLVSVALFDFGKSGMDDLSQEGRASLDNVVRRVIKDYATVDSISIFGHSDPIGRPERKQIVSAERAQTVRDYLRNHGLPTTHILSEGRADTEPAVTNCGVTLTPLNVLCNRPNRRVTIEITGIRR